MKKIATSLLFVLIAVAFAGAQNKEEYKLNSFTRISFRAAGKLYLRQGSPQKVEIEGDRDYIKELDVRVEGDKLVIGKDNNWSFWNWDSHDNDRVNVYITVANINGVSVAGSGDVIGETKITSSDLDLSVSGSGGLQLEADVAGDLDADVSGSGHIDFKGKCRDFDSHVSGSGRVKMDIDIAERAMLGISGSGKIEATGSAKEVKASISGSGEVRGARMVVDNCDVRISGSGGVEINVNKELDANISGSGSVRYSGNPAHVNSHSSGSGSVRKVDSRS
jgi:hypothetical protein